MKKETLVNFEAFVTQNGIERPMNGLQIYEGHLLASEALKEIDNLINAYVERKNTLPYETWRTKVIHKLTVTHFKG
jgi:hypothetical protein